MFALDFKLTSAQVKVLLYEWHGHHWADGERPARDLFHSEHFMAVRAKLCQKGLMEVVGEKAGWRVQGIERMIVTPAGAAIAEHIVLQAQKILSLNESRREFQAALPTLEAEAEARSAHKLPSPEVLVRRREGVR